MDGKRSIGDQPILEIAVTVESGAAPEAVYDVVADLRTHAEWNGAATLKRSGLLSVDAPEGPATVGTEWRSTGKDLDGTFADRSVVTEAMRPSSFEFVTEARQERKRGEPRDWTLVSRYTIEPLGSGSRITYRARTVRLSSVPKPFVLPVIKRIAMAVPRSLAKKAIRSLARYAERVGAAG